MAALLSGQGLRYRRVFDDGDLPFQLASKDAVKVEEVRSVECGQCLLRREIGQAGDDAVRGEGPLIDILPLFSR